jgi:DNA invertase Pin-like site-specific DNA recombinase
MAVIGYARVSTTDQDSALQEQALVAAGCERIFVDRASGALAHRPELDAALAYLRAGDTLVVWRLDRLGRSLRHLLETVDALGEREVGFKSLAEALDTTTSSGRLLFAIVGAIAEFERELIRERTRAGLAAVRARGRTGGRKPLMTPTKVTLARRMYDEGVAASEIAKTLGVSRPTVYRHLKENLSNSATSN